MRSLLLCVFAVFVALPAAAQSPRLGVGVRAGYDLPAFTLTWSSTPPLMLRAEGYLRSHTESLEFDFLNRGRAGDVRVFTDPRLEETTRGLGLSLQVNLTAMPRSYVGLSGRYVSRVSWYHNVPVCPGVCAPEPWFRSLGDMRVHSYHTRLGALAGAEIPLFKHLALSVEMAYFGGIIPLSGDMDWMFEEQAVATVGLTYYVR